MKHAPNEACGTVQPFKDAKGGTYFRARISLVDGERMWVGPRFSDRGEAETYAAEKSAEARRRGLTVAKLRPKKPDVETADQWHERYLEACEARGIGTTRSKRGCWTKWISPKIGHRTMASVTRDLVEDVRDALDDVIREYEKHGPGKGRLSHKTAQNVWGELTVSFDEACNSKRRELRCVTVDPTTGVKPPEHGGTKSKVYPHPSEALAVFACEDVPVRWRELHAIACYTFTRPGELWVLRWSDVDLHDQTIRVTKAWDFDHKRVKLTKTHETRVIPIEPALLPLLVRMHADAKVAAAGAADLGLVVPFLSTLDDNKLAIHTRAHFTLAECTRARLEARNAAELRLRFRSWRDAGITWSIVRGDDVVRVQRRAGHKLIATTMRYIVEAENRGVAFGTPFPTLPPELVSPGVASKLASNLEPQAGQVTESLDDSECRRRESKPLRATESAAFPGVSRPTPGGSDATDVAKYAKTGRVDSGLDAALRVALDAARAAGDVAMVARLEALLP